MTDDEIHKLFSYCVGNKGTIKAWPDALGGIIGQVQVTRPSIFCDDCPEIMPSPYINVNATVSKILIKPILQSNTNMQSRITSEDPTFSRNEVRDPFRQIFRNRWFQNVIHYV